VSAAELKDKYDIIAVLSRGGHICPPPVLIGLTGLELKAFLINLVKKEELDFLWYCFQNCSEFSVEIGL